MKHKLLIAAAASALMAAPSLAQAQDDTSGWYLRGNAGYGTHTDMDFTGELNGDVESEGNVAYSLGAGYDFGENWRVELDGMSLWTDLGSIAQLPASSAKIRTNSLMLNAIYDFDDFNRWEPYVGAGIGLVQGKLDASAHDFLSDDANQALIRTPACTTAFNPNDGRTCDFHDKDTALGWQLLAGLGYAISDKLTWDTQYRYQDAGAMVWDGTATNLVAGTSSAIQTASKDVASHSVTTGFRYLFGTPTVKAPEYVAPPAPVERIADVRCWDGSMVFNLGQCAPEPRPEPQVRCWDGSMVFNASECAAQPATFTCPDGSLVYDLETCPRMSTTPLAELCGEQYRQEIIYYEFDKGASAETRNTINRILDVGQFCNVDNIRVVGHTDTSGAASYNLNLSKRRAKDARDELVRQGVNGSVITSEGKGETEPFVQTGDGVKEQLNRRTEVLITLGSIGAMSFSN